MANAWYPLYEQALRKGEIAGGEDAVDIKFALVDLDHYTYSAAHQYLSDVTADASAVLGTSGNLANKTFSGATMDADDATAAAVTGTVTALISYVDTGNENTSPLRTYMDTDASSNPISVVFSGADARLVFHASGVDKLGAA